MRLVNNSRFYILLSSVLLSVVVVCGLRLAVPSDQLFAIRIQQIYGLLAVVFLYIAVILTPLSKLVRGGPLPYLLFSRRAIGVAAFYFALLHTLIALFDQTGGWAGIALLPPRFKVAFVIGAVALLILFLMAVTSFDKAIQIMTFKRWKQLHRFVYMAGFAVIVHVWLIGTHGEYISVRLASLVALALLFGLEAVRIARAYAAKYKLEAEATLAVGALAFGLMLGALFLLPIVAPNFHSAHRELHEEHQRI